MIDSTRRFDELRATYAQSLGRKRQALARAWQAFAGAPDDEAPRRQLHLLIHRLSGSSVAYGYAVLGENARSVDALLRRWDELAPDARDSASELAERLTVPMRALLEQLQSEADDTTSPQEAEVPRALRVLIVEDDPGQAMLVGAQLESLGCEVRFESSGDRLWQTLTLWPCDAVVLDYWLRGETADELASMLRREPRFERIAMVCFTAENDPQVMRAALDAGCDAAIGKQEGVERLYQAIRESVARPDRAGRPLD